jgi:hypothetical protein
MKIEWRVTEERRGGTGSKDLYKLNAVGFGAKAECDFMMQMYSIGLDTALEQAKDLNKLVEE